VTEHARTGKEGEEDGDNGDEKQAADKLMTTATRSKIKNKKGRAAGERPTNKRVRATPKLWKLKMFQILGPSSF
jgi:hypothetical protein